jgi:hypothetical protein
MSRQNVLVICSNALLGILIEEGKYSNIFPAPGIIVGIDPDAKVQCLLC